MGRIMTLQLFGTAIHCRGVDESRDRSVVRLRGPDDPQNETVSDFALIRTSEDFERAKGRNWQSFFAIGEEVGSLVSEADGRAIVVSS